MAEAIRDDELDALFGDTLGGFRTLVLAVSGGADSTALMYLVARWAGQAGERGPHVIVATFDHGLRPASAAEAAWVAEQALAIGLTHQTLAWVGAKPRTGVQAAARKARYDALVALAHDLSVDMAVPAAVVTAHHLQDQAETVLMRMARGSGVDGLSGMAGVRWVTAGRVAVARPLLGVGKDRLRATLEAGRLVWCEDPSNEDPSFERVRVRRAGAALAEIGITPEALGLMARRIGRAREALDDLVVAAESRVLATNRGAFARLSKDGFAGLSQEVRVRILARVLFAFGGQDTPPELAQVEALTDAVQGAESGFRTTMGGCLVSVGRDAVVVHREPGRAMPSIIVQPGERAWWDRRFGVEVAARALGPLQVCGLGPAEAAAAAELVPGLSRVAAATLPTGWNDYVREGAEARSEALVRLLFTYPRTVWT